MRRMWVVAAVLVVAACRGEKVPRDYQNQPPAMTHPPTKPAQTPSAKGMPGPPPEPSTAVQGNTTKTVNPVPAPPPKLKDQAPPATTT